MAIHVLIDNTDWWAVVAALAAVAATVVGVFALGIGIQTLRQARRQTRLAEGALTAAQDELQLARAQLTETQASTHQTQEALELGRQQLEHLQRADFDRARALAPVISARIMKDPEAPHSAFGRMYLRNSGAVATHTLVTGRDVQGQFHNIFIQTLGAGEETPVPEFQVELGKAQYCQFIRIRAHDALRNKYITEYRSLGETLAYPIFREPWLCSDFAPRPARCSDEVSWPVEHFERLPGQPDEPVEEGFNINAPA